MILGLVCARKGSVGLPDKNIRELKGVKLIERAIAKAYEAGCDIVCASTDYEPFKDFAVYGGPNLLERAPELCGPDVSKWDVWRDAAQYYPEGDIIVDIDVTRPLCTAETVRSCIALVGAGAPAAMAVAESNKHPAFDIVEVLGDGCINPFDTGYTYRQQCRPVYQHAGCYVIDRSELFARENLWEGYIAPVIVDRIQSYDIDDELDWRIVEALA